MSEIVALREQFSSYANELTAKLNLLKTKILAVNKLDSFQGEAANAAKAYFTTVHGELIQDFEEAVKQMERNLTTITNEFHQVVDRSQSAIIKESYLQEMTQHITTVDQEVLDIHHDEQTIHQKISDIVALNAYQIQLFSSSVHESKRFLQQLMQDLHQFDDQALRKVKNSDDQLTSLKDKLNERKANRIKILTGNITALDLNDVENKSLSDMFGEGLSSLRHILAGLNTTDKRLTALYQTAVLLQRRHFLRTGLHSMTLAQYRRFNNMLRFSPYKISTKEFLWQFRDSKMKGFPKGKMEPFKRLIIPFGKNRGKQAMINEFNRIYGLDKYRQFKNLKSNKAKAASMAKTFYDKALGDKITTSKNIVKNTNWNKPKTFFKSVADEIKTKPQNANIFGKVASRSLGPLSAGLHIRENFIQHKGDTQKIVIGSAVDIGASSVATATGAAIGSAFIPPIGTVVGAAVGAGISTAFHMKLPWGKPPKSLSEHTKDLANKAVDGVKNIAKGIGKKISGWFK